MAGFDWISAGGALLGGLLGGKDQEQTQTAEKTPWGPAQPWMAANLADGQNLQRHYQQNPFNAQQQTAYNNTFSDIDNFRGNIAPGLMQFANNAMTGPGYQRQRYERPGLAGYGAGPAQSQQPGGLLAPSQSTPGPFSVAGGGQMGQMDFAAANPYANGSIKQQASVPEFLQALQEAGISERSEGNGDASGTGSTGSFGGFGDFGGMFGGMDNVGLNASNSTAGKGLGAGVSAALSAAFGPIGGLMASAYNAYDTDPAYNGYGGLDGTTTEATGPGTIGSRDSYGSNESSDSGYGGNGSESDSGPGGSSGDSVGGGPGSSSGNSGDGMGGWAKGGKVTGDRLHGANPSGPDDGYGALDAGEFVIRNSAVKKYGSAVMAALNAGKIDPSALKALMSQKKRG